MMFRVPADFAVGEFAFQLEGADAFFVVHFVWFLIVLFEVYTYTKQLSIARQGLKGDNSEIKARISDKTFLLGKISEKHKSYNYNYY
jgi:hypothetical protein